MGEWAESRGWSPVRGASNAVTPGSSPEVGDPSPKLGDPSPELGDPSPELGDLSPELGDPSPELGDPSPELGDPSPESGDLSPTRGGGCPAEAEGSPSGPDGSSPKGDGPPFKRTVPFSMPTVRFQPPTSHIQMRTARSSRTTVLLKMPTNASPCATARIPGENYLLRPENPPNPNRCRPDSRVNCPPWTSRRSDREVEPSAPPGEHSNLPRRGSGVKPGASAPGTGATSFLEVPKGRRRGPGASAPG